MWKLGDGHYNSVFEITRLRSFISGNTYIGTRHLYWILTGPSFAVHVSETRRFRADFRGISVPGGVLEEECGGVATLGQHALSQRENAAFWLEKQLLIWGDSVPTPIAWNEEKIFYFSLLIMAFFPSADEILSKITFAAPTETFKQLKSILMKKILMSKTTFLKKFISEFFSRRSAILTHTSESSN